MKWFKHMTDATGSDTIDELLAELGPFGYGVYWIICEKIALKLNGRGITSRTYSVKTWADFCKIRPSSFTKTAKSLSKLVSPSDNQALILFEKEGEKITIGVPKLLELIDDNTRRLRSRSAVTTDSLRSNPGVTTDQSRVEVDQIRTDQSTSTSAVDPVRYAQIKEKFITSPLVCLIDGTGHIMWLQNLIREFDGNGYADGHLDSALDSLIQKAEQSGQVKFKREGVWLWCEKHNPKWHQKKTQEDLVAEFCREHPDD